MASDDLAVNPFAILGLLGLGGAVLYGVLAGLIALADRIETTWSRTQVRAANGRSPDPTRHATPLVVTDDGSAGLPSSAARPVAPSGVPRSTDRATTEGTR